MKAKFKALLVVISALVVIATVCSSCSAVFGAFGDEAPSGVIVLDITGANLSFDDSVYIKYAVDFDESRVNIDDVHMLIWLEAQDEYTKDEGTHVIELDNAGTQNIDGVDHIIFQYSGLSASQMTDVVYARAYVEIDGEICYSDAKKYSVLQYAYNKMGKTAAASTDANLISLLENMLNYGALAQKYTNYKTGSLATDSFYQIKVAGGLLNDGFNHGLYQTGEKVTISAPETSNGAEFVAWRKKDGSFVSDSATVTVDVGTANEVYFAVYEIPDASANLQYRLNEDESAYIVTGVGTCTDPDIVIPSEIGKKLVTHIEDGAFANCTGIRSVTIGTAIVEIGDNAFNGCTSLTTVYYEGTKAQWNSVIKGTGWNTNTKNLQIKYAIDNSWELGGIPLQ